MYLKLPVISEFGGSSALLMEPAIKVFQIFLQFLPIRILDGAVAAKSRATSLVVR